MSGSSSTTRMRSGSERVVAVMSARRVTSRRICQPCALRVAVRWALANNVWVAALLIVVIAILLAGVFYTLLRQRAGQRIRGK